VNGGRASSPTSFGFQRLDSGLERRYRRKQRVFPISQQYPRPLNPARMFVTMERTA
jgi:hypothetical protein